MKPDTQESPLVCNMGMFTAAERESHVQATVRLIQSVQDKQAAENGFRLVFPNESRTITGLAEFISNERRCCPFLEFTLKIAPNDRPISLLLTGPKGTQEFLREELGEAFQ